MEARWPARLAILVLGVTLSMTTMEFVEVHQLSTEDLRRRFGLPTSCDPALTAVTSDPSANRMTVAIECRPAPATPASDRDRR
jgi:hypothetical protein